MGDMGDVFNAMRKEKKERHARWHKENREKIDASGIPYQDRGEALLFRFGKVKADFYPSTGRWRSGNRNFSGGAKSFLNWLIKRMPMRPEQKQSSAESFSGDESMTVFERQEAAWLDNDCEGNPSDEQYWDA